MPPCAYSVHHMLPVRAGDDNCVGNECSDIKAELMRRGGRLPERLIVREREWFACKRMTLANWQSPVNGQLSVGNWRVPNRGKLIGWSTQGICSATAKLYLIGFVACTQLVHTWLTTQRSIVGSSILAEGQFDNRHLFPSHPTRVGGQSICEAASTYCQVIKDWRW